jgi:hypothetical protein
MSSNMRILKICESCRVEFVAKTTVTQCCSDACAKRLYKIKKRNEAISRTKFGGAYTQIEVKLEDGTVWFAQDQMADLFQKAKSTISEHIKNIIMKKSLTTR